ncbi:MAG: SDR family NAD(P)-dependent oxidoreductase [Candidatus Eremiobacteraeota bacterium]|nr:SDR family NAD(P)-dependent oxidoreductase [Candidatus Eremiobacteraeota bacterium]
MRSIRNGWDARMNRVMIVTGASSGIGWALAERAVRFGWNVFAVGRRAERLAELRRTVEGATGTIEICTLDLRSPHAAAKIAHDTIGRFGRIDALVNNAGAVAVGPISFQSDDALYEQFETHAILPLALVRETLAELRASRGQIVFLGSGVARIPVGRLGAYPPAKAAVRNMSRIVRNELARDGIAVTYVDPGAVATEFMTRAGFSGPHPLLAASPYDVARRIYDAIERRKSVVNAVPWQTAFLSLAELVPRLTDFVLARAPQIVGVEALPPSAPAQPLPLPLKVEPVVAAEPETPPEPSAMEEFPHGQALHESPAAIVSDAPPAIVMSPPPIPPFDQIAEPAPAPTPPAAPPSSELNEPLSPFEQALQPHASRMRRLNLSLVFVRSLLVPGIHLDAGDVALRWTGMPNKNERSLTNEVLEALADAGFLERTGESGRYFVLRPAEEAVDHQ